MAPTFFQSKAKKFLNRSKREALCVLGHIQQQQQRYAKHSSLYKRRNDDELVWMKQVKKVYEFCLLLTSLGRCLLYVPISFSDDDYGSKCPVDVDKICTLICSLNQLGNFATSSLLKIQKYKVVVERCDDVLFAVFMDANSAAKANRLQMKRIVDEFVFLFEKPIADIKSIENQLVEQNSKNFVFKIKEKEKEEFTPVNRYPVLCRFSDIIKSKLFEIEQLEELTYDQTFKQINSLQRILIVDSSFTPLTEFAREKKNMNFATTLEWKYIQKLCARSRTLFRDASEESLFSYFLVNKAVVITVEERRNDYLFYIFTIEIGGTNNLQIQFNNDGTGTIWNLSVVEPQVATSISSFMQQVRNKTQMNLEQKEQIEREWTSRSLTIASKNGRKFFKNKNISTVITPADDDFTKYTPRPPPSIDPKYQQQQPPQTSPNERFVRSYKIQEQK
ncbi:hypothetical protein C9374_011379 [Naegleria lovaniensis]|uniref:Uncharacterized protein n=1 Tax=Naegleria lovaniensis TaxID=51637 RepID=A0AA88GY16_NAELO|nr:uncharacterized protein C9374_011379 [Naegleria lovaniensis]KAG2392654.1 hypothetical protein C9374_011379 [Naegleria lovaniensis]